MKLPLLQNCISHNGNDILDGLPTPANTPQQSFVNAVTQIETYFCSGSSVLLWQKLFFKAWQACNEMITEFSCWLWRLAKDCDFEASLDTMLHDIFVIGVWNDKLGESQLALDTAMLTFAVATQKSGAFEQAHSECHKVGQNQSMQGATVSHIKQSNATSTHNICDTENVTSNPTTNHCYQCGWDTHLANSADCPAICTNCKACGKTGHFKLMCRSVLPTVNQFQRTRQNVTLCIRSLITKCNMMFSLQWNPFQNWWPGRCLLKEWRLIYAWIPVWR